MKKFKISFVAIAALMLGLAVSAFTTTEPAKESTLDGWFIYNGGLLDEPGSYTYTTNISPCNAHATFCAFKGNRQAIPNQARPTQQSLDDAMSASDDFEEEVDELVVFKP